MFFKTPINWWFIGFLGVLTASLWFTHVSRVNHAVKLNTQVVETRMNKDYQGKLDKAVKDAIKTTKLMQADADKIEKTKNEKLQANNDQLSADIASLRKRTDRPSSTVIAESSKSGSSCTAAQLYREDAEFLTREASRADSVIHERDYYYERYIAAQKRLAELASQQK